MLRTDCLVHHQLWNRHLENYILPFLGGSKCKAPSDLKITLFFLLNAVLSDRCEADDDKTDKWKSPIIRVLEERLLTKKATSFCLDSNSWWNKATKSI